MDPRPPVLVLDDGELLRVERLLKQQGVPFVRRSGPAIGPVVQAPGRLLIASGPRMLEPPRFEAPPDLPEPIRMCIHGQDFLPLRQRLRELGVHFLVQGALDQQSLALLILQLLHRGPERRSERRLPLGGLLHVRNERAMLRARLIELSGSACCFQAERAFEPGAALTLLLPASLGGGDELTLPAHVTRCDAEAGGHRIVVALAEIGAEARRQLESLTRGLRIGARVTPLVGVSAAEAAAPPMATARPPAAAPNGSAGRKPADAREAGERRRAPRVARQGRVRALAGVPDPEELVLTRDLSRSGARIVGLSGVAVGQPLTLALYGAPREEPLVVEGRVVRDDGDAGIAVAFDALGEAQARQIDRLCGARARVEAVDARSGETHRVDVARVSRLRVV